MTALPLPPLKPYHPTTFLERGVAVPFTTPLLAGTRARPGDKKDLELVVPNPAGGRGVYILCWNAISALCCPTMHDRCLTERVAAVQSLTPSAIRSSARQVAAEGLAGADAMKAAQQSDQAERVDRLISNYLLLMALLEQTGYADAGMQIGAGTSLAEAQERARHAVAAVAPRVGRPPNWIATALEGIGDIMAPVGINNEMATSRMSRVSNLLHSVVADMTDWSQYQRSDDQVAYVEMICSVAGVTLRVADQAITKVRDLMKDVIALLRRWAHEPDAIVRLAAGPEWLLDGWEQICLRWTLAKDDAQRKAALVEMSGLVPILPREAREWSEIQVETEIPRRLRRMVLLREDWRTGVTVFEIIARNERICAMTC